MAREFLVQRYCRENHPQVRGLRPFVATGPSFRRYTTTQSLGPNEGWRFRPPFESDIAVLGPRATELNREIVAELFLREGIVQALWSVSSRECLPEDERWRASVKQVASEIPPIDPLSTWVIEFLSGLSDPSHFRSYVSEDGLELEPVGIPPE